MGSLIKLKNFEAASNELTALPRTFSQLAALQVIDVTSNQISSLSPISEITSLVSVKAGGRVSCASVDAFRGSTATWRLRRGGCDAAAVMCVGVGGGAKGEVACVAFGVSWIADKSVACAPF